LLLSHRQVLGYGAGELWTVTNPGGRVILLAFAHPIEVHKDNKSIPIFRPEEPFMLIQRGVQTRIQADGDGDILSVHYFDIVVQLL
jgi:hypothetical protein